MDVDKLRKLAADNEGSSWTGFAAVRNGEVLYASKEGGEDCAKITELSKMDSDAAIAEGVVLWNDDYQIHNKYEADGVTIMNGRRPVDANHSGVPAPDGWCSMSRGDDTVLATYKISITSVTAVKALSSLI
eukprot:TRINITY_DN6199_c0_g1_i5.p1 TRINITY_DN6199_c0_g1~~TRINITY_DN6199_c0_g1_i5.p1  ORF type:complete len:131 (+),score=28.36 TRINITY_DN6199_c0_g1_i5:58-450(+)